MRNIPRRCNRDIGCCVIGNLAVNADNQILIAQAGGVPIAQAGGIWRLLAALDCHAKHAGVMRSAFVAAIALAGFDVGEAIPGDWQDGVQYSFGGSFEPVETVIERRSDGSQTSVTPDCVAGF